MIVVATFANSNDDVVGWMIVRTSLASVDAVASLQPLPLIADSISDTILADRSRFGWSCCR